MWEWISQVTEKSHIFLYRVGHLKSGVQGESHDIIIVTWFQTYYVVNDIIHLREIKSKQVSTAVRGNPRRYIVTLWRELKCLVCWNNTTVQIHPFPMLKITLIKLIYWALSSSSELHSTCQCQILSNLLTHILAQRSLSLSHHEQWRSPHQLFQQHVHRAVGFAPSLKSVLLINR